MLFCILFSFTHVITKKLDRYYLENRLHKKPEHRYINQSIPMLILHVLLIVYLPFNCLFTFSNQSPQRQASKGDAFCCRRDTSTSGALVRLWLCLEHRRFCGW